MMCQLSIPRVLSLLVTAVLALSTSATTVLASGGVTSADEKYSIGSTTRIPNLSDGSVHLVKIEYLPGTLHIFLDDLTVPVLRVPLDLEAVLNSTDGTAWVGFTAATGGSWENHDILFFTFGPSASTQSTFPLQLVGDAVQLEDRLRLTPADPGQRGAAWTMSKQAVRDGFAATFSFQITDLAYGGADGFAFVVQNGFGLALGDGGNGLGYGGMANTLAVEFDTWGNPAPDFQDADSVGDPNDNHVSVHIPKAMSDASNDVILHGGVIVTMEADQPRAQAIAIRGDKLVAVGTDQEILALRGPETQVVDLGGKTVLPGFIDSHAYWINNAGRDFDDCISCTRPKFSTAQEAIQAALARGWTSLSELTVDQGFFDGLLALDRAGKLRLRVNAYLTLSERYERFGDWYKAYPPRGEFSPKLRIAGVKIFGDRGGNYGQDVFFSQEELNALVAEAHRSGFQIAIHTMADAGLDLVLNAYENALQGESNALYRHRIDHLTVVRDDQLDRMRNLGLIASFQMTWFNSDPFWSWDVRFFIGLDRAHLVGRWRDLLDAGIPSVGSTDFPWVYEHPNEDAGSAMLAISEAVTRVGVGSQSPNGLGSLPPPQWMLDQRISVEQALRLLTIDGAYGTFQEEVKGSIAVGKLADIVVLSENPLSVPVDTLKYIRVLATIVGGRTEHCATGHETLCPG